ncbi:MAG: glycosyltransferase [Chitinivibrionales bacterium]|nr:glycosyltransferase [Chitinivibrionales bacterium]
MVSSDITVIIPAYNEESSLPNVLERIKKLGRDYEIIVVDDGSGDGTSACAAGTTTRLVRHETNRGYGASLKSGIRAASNEIIAICDGDGTYPVEAIPGLVDQLDKCDMAVGARNSKSTGISMPRRWAKLILSCLANYLAGTRIPDINSGLRAFRRTQALAFFNILPSGFSFTTTITLAMLTNNYIVTFVPIEYYKRSGKSKIKPLRDFTQFISQILRTVMYFNPMKVFLPASIFMAAIAGGVFFYSLLFADKILDTTVVIFFMTAIQLFAIGMLAELIEKRSNRINDS